MPQIVILVCAAERSTIRYTKVADRICDWAYKGAIDAAFEDKIKLIQTPYVRLVERHDGEWVYEFCTSTELVKEIIQQLKTGELKPSPYQIDNDNRMPGANNSGI